MLDSVLLSGMWEFKGWVKNGVMNKFHSAGHQTGEVDDDNVVIMCGISHFCE